jgi:hypothetical protein
MVAKSILYIIRYLFCVFYHSVKSLVFHKVNLPVKVWWKLVFFVNLSWRRSSHVRWPFILVVDGWFVGLTFTYDIRSDFTRFEFVRLVNQLLLLSEDSHSVQDFLLLDYTRGRVAQKRRVGLLSRHSGRLMQLPWVVILRLDHQRFLGLHDNNLVDSLGLSHHKLGLFMKSVVRGADIAWE